MCVGRERMRKSCMHVRREGENEEELHACA